MCLVVGDPLAVVDTSVQRDVGGEGQESHGEDCMTRLPAGPIAPPAAGIQLQFGPHGYPSSRAGSRKVEGTISGAVAWPTGSRSKGACTLIALATVKRSRRNWVGVFAYLA